MSHLLQMRGLKHRPAFLKTNLNVASFTDAWIETNTEVFPTHEAPSHLLQMRGLKPTPADDLSYRDGRIFYRCVD